jgi:hypothetical protein
MTNSSPRIFLASLLASLSMLLMPLGAHAGGTGKDLRNAYHDLKACIDRTMDPSGPTALA